METMRINRTLTLQYLCRRTHALAIIIVLTVGILYSVLPVSAEIVDFVIQGPDGGDCEFLGGEWSGHTCTVASLRRHPPARQSSIEANERLTIQRGALLVVTGQVNNRGTIFVRSDAPDGAAELRIERGVAFFNLSVLGIVLNPLSTISPGVSNYGFLYNFGSIINQGSDRIGGIFNNFGILYNYNNGDIPGGFFLNNGYFFNSGPPVTSHMAEVHFLGDGFLTNGNNGLIDNLGIFNGRLEGACVGICD